MGAALAGLFIILTTVAAIICAAAVNIKVLKDRARLKQELSTRQNQSPSIVVPGESNTGFYEEVVDLYQASTNMNISENKPYSTITDI